MKFLRFVAFLATFLSFQFLFSQSDEKWTLEKCVNYALQHNIQVQQAGVVSKISSNDNLQSKLNFLPSIDGNGSFSNNYGSGFNPQTYSFAQGTSQTLQTSLQAVLPVFTGLQQVFNVERTKYDLLASKYDYENARNSVALSVASAYLDILLSKEMVKVAEKQKVLSEAQRSNLAAKIRTGSLPETSAYEVESQLARDEANIVNAKNAVDLRLLSLKQLLQFSDPKFDLDVPEITFEKVEDVASLSSQAVYDYAESNQPVIKGALARVNSANASRKISYGALSPTIAVFGTLSTSYFSEDRKVTGYGLRLDTFEVQGNSVVWPSIAPDYTNKSFSEHLKDNFRKAVGVSLSVPLFSKWQRVTNIQNAKLQMQIRQLQLEGSKNQLRQDIELAYTNAKAAVQSYLANKKAVESAEKAYNALEKRFNAGMFGSFELQQSKNNLAVAESEMLRAKYTYIFRLKVLDFYQGKPLTLNQ